MSARVLDGQALAARMQGELVPQVAEFAARHGRPPGLAIMLIGHDPASEVYVASKLTSGARVGLRADLERLPATATLDDALALVERLNGSDVYDGILVQSPLPARLGREAEHRVFDAILPAKDVDGFTPANVGRMLQDRAALVACTPAGILELLVREQIPMAGRHAVVIGRSHNVGKPMAMLLLRQNATVTICHSKSQDLAGICRQADILVSAVGRPGLVTPEFVKPGATVVDVGINRLTDAAAVQAFFPEGHPRLAVFRSKGSVLVGDVHPAVADIAGALTPVPGGVGPMTVTMLMVNTLQAARLRMG
jgi:methylenetetrahydrofolate dehydrogenase (NADP+)/methenyltetrahydrofolate cyclohydrolase